MTAGDRDDLKLARAPGVLWRRTLRGVLVNVPGRDEPVLLTTPGDEVWALLAEPRSSLDLVKSLAQRFDADPAKIESDLEPVLAELLTVGALIKRS